MNLLHLLPSSFSVRLLILLTLAVGGGRCFGQEAESAANPSEGSAPAEASADVAEDEAAMKGVSIFERLGQGGITMLIIGLLSVTALTSAIERGLNLKKRAIAPEGLSDEVKSLWSREEYEEVLNRCRQHPSILGHVITYLVSHRTCNTLELSTIAGDIAGREVRGQLQKAYPLAIISTVAPLLGLFGTVLGMIDSFEVVAIAGSMGDASILAGGISKALVTTAGGLALAIPTLGAYHYFKSRTISLSLDLEREINDLLSTWFLEKANTQQG